MGLCFISLKYFGIKNCYFDPVSISVGPYDETQICIVNVPGQT